MRGSKRFLVIAKFIFLFIWGVVYPASGESYFRVIGGIPHFPEREPSSVPSPAAGMIVYSREMNQPLIFTGSGWVDLCSSNLVSVATSGFQVTKGIPFLSISVENPDEAVESGAVYYSSSEGSVKIYNGEAWQKIALHRGSGAYVTGNGFSAISSLNISKLPVLNSNPAPAGLSAGAVYINAIAKVLRYYDGGKWVDVSCTPVVTTLDPYYVTNTGAESGADIRSTGGSDIIYQGIVWSGHPNATLDTLLSTKTRSGAGGTGVYPSLITGLVASTTYYVRAYAVNGSGISYGEIKSFKTADASVPRIVTLPVANIEAISAESGGDIPSTGGSNVTDRGIIWNTTGDPLLDSVASIVDPVARITKDGSGPGLFPTRMTGLLENTTYYVRAYAVNRIGTAYGNLVTFSTLPATTPVLSSPNISITNITDSSARSQVTILNNGGAEVVERGVAWSTERIAAWDYLDPRIQHNPSVNNSSSDIGTFNTFLSPLQPGTLYYVRAYAKNRVGTTYSSETSFRTTSLPTVFTLPQTTVSGLKVTISGEVTSAGVSEITQRGFVWGETPDFDPRSVTSDRRITLDLGNRSGLGIFNAQLSGLNSNTVYWVRAFATNNIGTAFGDTVSFITAKLPTVTTNENISVLAYNRAAGAGNVTDEGRDEVVSKGVCWSTGPEPTIADSYIISGSGKGAFISTLNGLQANTTYFLRAFAINSAGTGYGSPVAFTTSPAILPTVITVGVTDISADRVLGIGGISSDGGATVTRRGICWNTTGNPVVDEDSFSDSGGGTGNFSVAITGLSTNQTYYARAYAVNSAGIVYGGQVIFRTFTTPAVVTNQIIESSVTSTGATGGGDILSDGGSPVVNSGLVWSTWRSPAVRNYSGISGGGPGIGQFTMAMDNLMGNTTYYVRAYATNAAGTAYGEEMSFTTAPPVPPSVVTRQAINITGSTAISGGTVTDKGGALVTHAGIVWSETPGFDAAAVPAQNRIINAGSMNFTATISGLRAGSVYYVRAFAENSAGITFGNEVTFTTLRYATVTTNEVASSITSTTAVSGGVVTSNGGTYVGRNGVVWSTHPSPTVSDHVSAPAGAGTGSFTAHLTGLKGSTVYYVRAYAENSAGIAYGNEVQFTTAPPVAPSITTAVPEVLSATVIRGGGNISSDGGAQISTRGLVWSTVPGFDPAGVPEADRAAETGYTTGRFTMDLRILLPGVTYFLRAFASNDAGFTSYGEEISIRVPSVPGVTTAAPLNITNKGALGGGSVFDNGGATVVKCGVVWSTQQGFDPDTLVRNRIEQGAAVNFTSHITGLLPSTRYYVRAYATSIAGTGYGPEISFVTAIPDLPTLATITTNAPVVTGSQTAVAGGTITDDGNAQISTRGVVWSTRSGFDPDAGTVNRISQSGSAMGTFSIALAHLVGGTTYYVRAFVENSIGLAYGEERSFTTHDSPEVYTSDTTSATARSAVAGGSIAGDGGTEVISFGLVWSTAPGPHTGLVTKIAFNGRGKGNFSGTMEDLAPATEYYYRAYAINRAGTGYGQELRFVTPPALPKVITSEVFTVSEDSAEGGGEIQHDGGAPVTARGLVWSTNPNYVPDTVIVNRTAVETSEARFASTLIGLEDRITYYVRAYATNRAGTAYGDAVAFSMFATSAELITAGTTDIKGTTAKSGGTVTRDGGSPVHTWGVVWSATDPNPVIARNSHTSYSGTNDGSAFTSIVTGLTPNTKYFIRAYAINDVGVAYGLTRTFETATVPTLTATGPLTDLRATGVSVGGEVTDTGRLPVLERGVVWSQYNDPSTAAAADRTVDTTARGTGSFVSSIRGLKPATTYYVWAYARNEAGISYGTGISFKTMEIMLPDVTTRDTVRNVSANGGESGGAVSDDGGAPVTARGVVWSTSPAPTISLATKMVSGSGTGSFACNITGLQPKTTYYVRAFATNSKGTGYGEDVVFTTEAMKPSVGPVNISNRLMESADADAVITGDGGEAVTKLGLVWNTSGTIPGPADHTYSADGAGPNIRATLTGLLPGTTYYVWGFATNVVGTGYSQSPAVFSTPKLPVVTTTMPGSVTGNTAASGGNVTDNGGLPVLERGLMYDTISPLSVESMKVPSATTPATGAYTINLSSLKMGTTYYVRAYAENAVGVGYGQTESFTTLNIPTVTTTAPVLDANGTAATTGGQITSDGGKAVTARGVVWSLTDRVPTVALATKTANGTGLGTFVSTISTLLPGRTYYVRAYATNSMGTGYGNVDSIVVPALKPTLTKVVISNMNLPTADAAARVIADGGAPIEEQGFVWNTTGQEPDLSTDMFVSSGAIDDAGGFAAVMSGLQEGPVYYCWSYARNSSGVGFGPAETFVFCNEDFTVMHIAGHNGAPETKEVTYKVASSNISGDARCWITQNLGADRQATAATDNSEAAAGWYWQFNRLQGYKYSGAVRTPNTPWITSITESSDWMPENDPCSQLLGSGWRMPTSSEWTAADGAPQNWSNYNQTFASVLKLHAGGYLSYGNGVIGGRGTQGVYWSSSQAASTSVGLTMDLTSSKSALTNAYKMWAYTVRCLQESSGPALPSVSISTINNMTGSSADVQAAVTPEGSSPVTSRGLVWNTTGDPTVDDNRFLNGAGIGSFTNTLTGLAPGTVYYLRAFAINGQGLAYSKVVELRIPSVAVVTTTKPSAITRISGTSGGNVTDNGGGVITERGVCWSTTGLPTIADSRVSAVINTSNSFTVQLTGLTEGTKVYLRAYAINSSGVGYGNLDSLTTLSVPKLTTSEVDPTSITKASAIGGGAVTWDGGVAVTARGIVWSTSPNPTTALATKTNHGGGSLPFTSNLTGLTPSTTYYVRAYAVNSQGTGYGNEVAFTTLPNAPVLSQVILSDMTASSVTGSASITSDGGVEISALGLVWNTTGNPTVDNNVVPAGNGSGDFQATLTGLTEGSVYYVRAYATNSGGTGYGPVLPFKVCAPSMTVSHQEGLHGAPETKTVTYEVVSSNISGVPRCWITQNLGADRQAASADDPDPSAAGWYWQYGTPNGYKHDGTALTPGGWSYNVDMSSWPAAKDPCAGMLGEGWRVPTAAEWTSADGAPQNWLNSSHTFNSALKLHAAGYLNIDGTLKERGATGRYWSSSSASVFVSSRYFLNFNGTISSVNTGYAYFGFTLRCIK